MATSSLSRFSKLATDPIRNFRFLVEFLPPSSGDAVNPSDGTYLSFTGGFTQVGGLNITTQSIAYREGGMNTTIHQVPGQTSFSDITLQRGVIYGKAEAINWMKTLFAASAGEGLPGNAAKNFRCDLKIYVLDHPLTATELDINDIIGNSAKKMQFWVHNAWIKTLAFNDLSAADNNLLYETITLAHEGISVSYV